MSYDPDPRRKRRGTRRGGLPKSIIRKYGISKRAWQVFRGGRTHDPRRRGGARADHKPYGVGRKGGVYWSGARKPRYDPARRTRFARARRYGSKVENIINRHAGKIGAGLAALVGIGTGISEYSTAYGANALSDYWKTLIGGTTSLGEVRGPEISMLWAPRGTWTTLDYLKAKFLGLDTEGQYKGSAWVIPFWASLAGWIFSILPLGSKLKRIQKPISGMSKSALVVSTIGALAVPGTPKPADSTPTSNSNTPRTIVYTYGR